MFEFLFKEVISSFTGNRSTIEKFWNEIKTKYSKATRHYHSLNHLNNLVLELLPVKNKISDWQIVMFSVAYHDIIYNTLKNYKEEKSAQFAKERFTRLSIQSNRVQNCYN